MTVNPLVKIWQENGRWLLQRHPDGPAVSFATRDEAIAFSASDHTDGPTAARAETQRGDMSLAENTTLPAP